MAVAVEILTTNDGGYGCIKTIVCDVHSEILFTYCSSIFEKFCEFFRPFKGNKFGHQLYIKNLFQCKAS